MDQHCVICKMNTDFRCARCQEYYCSHSCQISDWPYHKLTCFPLRWGAKLHLATALDGFVNISKQTSELQLQLDEIDDNAKKNQLKLIWNLITSIIGKEILPLIDMSIESSHQHTSPKFVIRIFGRIWICADVMNPTINFLLGLVGRTKLLDRTSKDSYITSYKLMLQYEMEEEEMQLKKFEKIDVKLTHDKNRIFYFPITVDMLELSNAIDKNQVNQFILKPKTASIYLYKQIIASIKRQKEGNVYIEIRHWDSFNMIDTNETYSMHFEVNSKNFEAQTNALKYIDKHDLFDCLIDNPAYKLQGDLKSTVRVHYHLIPGNHQYANIKYHEKRYPGQVNQNRISTLDDTDLNSEQKTAVENIVSGNSYPLPYLLYGPPGTGKTKTIVEAIEEIVRTTTKNILVCAMSNAACDEITERLLIGPTKRYIYRMYAVSYNTDHISSSIKEVCNIFGGKLYVPHLSTLYEYQVIICTLATAGWMSETNADPKVYRADHFQYVFIDECASSHETMTLIPISGLCSSLKKIHANIVLSGDPKQLPAVTKSRLAELAGFNISWMEHLLDLKLYKRSSKTGKFNETYITQLVQNYRSHAAILKIPNELFYNGQLKAKASSDITDWFINSNMLPSKQFPIIFESVQGFSERANDKSLFNMKEIEFVVDYISKLLETNLPNNRSVQKADIGIVTPYKMQCKKIAQACRYRQWNEITVGTSEAFQGKEKPIMIVSTVRSDGRYLGFTKDPRRMNVVITRAKCLLIIVGDPHTLKLDDNWAALIKYCIDNNSLIQNGKRIVM